MIIRINNLIVICQVLQITLRQRKEMMKMYSSSDKELFINYYKIEKSIKRNSKPWLKEVLQKTIKTQMKGWGMEEYWP